MLNEEYTGEENTVAIYRAPDEVTANLVRGLLVGEDIPVMLKSRQVPWMNGVMKMGEGYWGDVVVFEKYADRSRRLIDDYLAGANKKITNESDQPNE